MLSHSTAIQTGVHSMGSLLTPDCVCSFVGREQLPALEFVMSKQPRVIVGVDAYSHGGQRSEDVFIAAVKFLKKCAEREQEKRSNLQVSIHICYRCMRTMHSWRLPEQLLFNHSKVILSMIRF